MNIKAINQTRFHHFTESSDFKRIIENRSAVLRMCQGIFYGNLMLKRKKENQIYLIFENCVSWLMELSVILLKGKNYGEI